MQWPVIVCSLTSIWGVDIPSGYAGDALALTLYDIEPETTVTIAILLTG